MIISIDIGDTKIVATVGSYADTYEEEVGVGEISNYIASLEHVIERLKELNSLIDEYGEFNLVAWKKLRRHMLFLQEKITYARTYESDPDSAGRYHEECYDNLEKTEKELEKAIKYYLLVPIEARNYLEFTS